ncbi:MAG: hypothetical protein QOD72_2734 [Acidimicrobiaceae bacterium]|jgi:hypothetical protein|nr:hypothetical protein [Acidimicrobiaceae bacterium]
MTAVGASSVTPVLDTQPESKMSGDRSDRPGPATLFISTTTVALSTYALVKNSARRHRAVATAAGNDGDSSRLHTARPTPAQEPGRATPFRAAQAQRSTRDTATSLNRSERLLLSATIHIACVFLWAVEHLPPRAIDARRGTEADLPLATPAALPDVLVIVTASTLGADTLVTTDRRWPPRTILGLAGRIVHV